MTGAFLPVAIDTKSQDVVHIYGNVISDTQCSFKGFMDGGCFCFFLSSTFRWESSTGLCFDSSDSEVWRRKSVKNNQDQTKMLIKIKERDLKNQFKKNNSSPPSLFLIISCISIPNPNAIIKTGTCFLSVIFTL